jgi:hypothetical protein
MLASAITLVRRHYPAATANLKPWRDDALTREWSEPETLDLAFHFPGWSPRLQCRSLLMQLRLSAGAAEDQRRLLGVLMRGMTYDGERWRLATVGEWQPAGPHLPQPEQIQRLRQICRELFELFDGCSSSDAVA